MRPASIIQFEKYFLISLALNLVGAALSYQDSLAMMQEDPALSQLGFGSGFYFLVLAIGLGIPVLLWFFIARKASTIAKWILVVLTALGLLLMIPTFPALLQGGMTSFAVTLLVTALQVFAITFLFRADAKAWFDGKPEVDPATFD